MSKSGHNPGVIENVLSHDLPGKCVIVALLRDQETNVSVSCYHPMLSLCLVTKDTLTKRANERYINVAC